MKAVAAIIFSEDKQSILLAKRSANHKNEAGKWENVGGKVEEGESFEDALVREVREELGVAATVLRKELEYGDQDSEDWVKLFSVTLDDEPAIKEPNLCDELKWFGINELQDLDLAQYTHEDFKRLGWI